MNSFQSTLALVFKILQLEKEKSVSYKTKQVEESRVFCTPVLRTLLTAGAVELIESPDRPCSISVAPGGDKDGGLTEDSWTCQKGKKEKITQVYLKEHTAIASHWSYRYIL